MNMEDLIAGIVEAAKQNNPQTEGDYEKDGILYCGKCHTPKEHIDRFIDIGRKLPCLCECRQRELEAEEQRKRQEERQDYIRRLRQRGFPESQMERWTFDQDDGKNPRLSEIARKYVEKFDEINKGLLLFGGVGVGKSFIAACIANALIDKGHHVLMTNLQRITNTMMGMYEGRQEYLDDLDRFDLLIIDDLGAERETEYMAEAVQNIVDSRYRCGKPLIVTTNLTGDELKHPADLRKARTYSRLYEMCYPVEVQGEDRRRKALKSQYDELSEILGIRKEN